MNQPAQREVLECASPLALSDLVRARKSGRGLPQSKTLARQRPPRRGSLPQCMRESERRLSMNRSPGLQLRQVRRRKKTLIAPGWSPALQFRGSWSPCVRESERGLSATPPPANSAPTAPNREAKSPGNCLGFGIRGTKFIKECCRGTCCRCPVALAMSQSPLSR